MNSISMNWIHTAPYITVKPSLKNRDRSNVNTALIAKINSRSVLKESFQFSALLHIRTNEINMDSMREEVMNQNNSVDTIIKQNSVILNKFGL